MRPVSIFFFFNDTATTEIYTLSLHDALPISWPCDKNPRHQREGDTNESKTDRTVVHAGCGRPGQPACHGTGEDRKSTRLNSSHSQISYAVFCLKKKIHHKGSRPRSHRRPTVP